MPLRVAFEAIGWESNTPAREVIDLAEDFRCHLLFMMLANGNYIEARAVGESPEAVEIFRRLMTKTGLWRVSRLPDRALLYQPGDELYGAPDAFVFVCPTPVPCVAGGPAEPGAAADGPRL